MTRKFLFLIAIFFIIIISSVVVIIINNEEPPENSIANAREQIALARQKGAEKFAKKNYLNATAAYDSSMHYWNIENKKLALFRNYDKSREWAEKSYSLANEAINNSSGKSDSMKNELLKLLQKTEKMLNEYEINYKNIPQSESIRKSYNKGAIFFNEAQLAYEKKDFDTAKAKIETSAKHIKTAIDYCSKLLNDYFKDYQNWKKWVNDAILHSKKNHSACIIVDKMNRECYLYQSGKLTSTYEADLGKNWIGDKKHQGDYSTPEGEYKVTDKKQNGRTKYHKALLINYPNKSDQIRFDQNKIKGLIPARKKIGGLIEIHGHGGQGADWTQGCIALSNNDMDKLFAKVSVGTPIIIVGSTKPLNEVIKSSGK